MMEEYHFDSMYLEKQKLADSCSPRPYHRGDVAFNCEANSLVSGQPRLYMIGHPLYKRNCDEELVFSP